MQAASSPFAFFPLPVGSWSLPQWNPPSPSAVLRSFCKSYSDFFNSFSRFTAFFFAPPGSSFSLFPFFACFCLPPPRPWKSPTVFPHLWKCRALYPPPPSLFFFFLDCFPPYVSKTFYLSVPGFLGVEFPGVGASFPIHFLVIPWGLPVMRHQSRFHPFFFFVQAPRFSRRTALRSVFDRAPCRNLSPSFFFFYIQLHLSPFRRWFLQTQIKVLLVTSLLDPFFLLFPI